VYLAGALKCGSSGAVGIPRVRSGDRWRGGMGRMKKAITIVLDKVDWIELARALIDDDAEAAMAFLKRQFKGKARELLEGGRKVMLEVPGSGIRPVPTLQVRR
jgi:hypothetical protein